MARPQFSPRVQKLLSKKGGVLLDISFGGTPQPRSLTLGPHGDIRHDPRKIPFPLPDAIAHHCVVVHVLEYIEPSQWFAWWDELHRIMRPHGYVYVSGPYGGDDSQGWLCDPTHKTRVVEQSMAWLDPRTPLYGKHAEVGRKTPRPWYPQALARVPGPDASVGYNFVLTSQPVNARG